MIKLSYILNEYKLESSSKGSMYDPKRIKAYYEALCKSEGFKPLPVKFGKVKYGGAVTVYNSKTMKPLYISFDVNRLSDPEFAIIHELTHQIKLETEGDAYVGKRDKLAKFKKLENRLIDKYFYSEYSKLLYEIKNKNIMDNTNEAYTKGNIFGGNLKIDGKQVPNCVSESVVNEDIDDLVGDTYSFEIGSGTDKMIKPNPREFVIAKLSEALQHYLFDFDFYYYHLDSSDKKIYLNLFQREVLKPFLHKNNINRTLNKYFTVDSNRKKVSWKLSSRDSEKLRDEFFIKNKKIPSNIKREYYEYRLGFSGYYNLKKLK